MRVLLLSPYQGALRDTFLRSGDEVRQVEDRLDGVPDFDFIVSYGYRFVLKEPLVSAYAGRSVNLHISLLPWNRGADPNFWSWIDGTPKGVSIHAIDAGLDTGPLYAQETVDLGEDETLRSSYERLQRAVEVLFGLTWRLIRDGRREPWPQPAGGSFHRAAEKYPIFKQLPLGWDTPCRELAQYRSKAA